MPMPRRRIPILIVAAFPSRSPRYIEARFARDLIIEIEQAGFVVTR
jgi:hypothetical protein